VWALVPGARMIGWDDPILLGAFRLAAAEEPSYADLQAQADAEAEAAYLQSLTDESERTNG
jgi:hypothetical protein